jgi:hypothetical protein
MYICIHIYAYRTEKNKYIEQKKKKDYTYKKNKQNKSCHPSEDCPQKGFLSMQVL